MIPNEIQQLLVEVFTPEWEEGRRSNRMDKCEELYQLGQEAIGPIVELGAWRGCGCTTLALGAEVPVFGVDDYLPRIGAFNDPYGPQDEPYLWENTMRCGVNVGLIRKSSFDAARYWKGPLGLVYWDLSHGSCLPDFRAWRNKISKGGRFVLGDTTDHIFEGDKMIAEAVGQGWTNMGRLGRFLYGVQNG